MVAFTTERITRPTHQFQAKSFAIENATDGEFAATMVRKAGEYLQAGDVTAAEKCLRMGLQKVPDHPQCLAYLAVCVAVGQRNLDTAEKLAKTIIQANPGAATAYYALGLVELLREHREAAFRHFSKARRLAADDQQMQGELDRIEPRRPAVLRFLSRNHPLNIALGKLRATLERGRRR